MQHSFSLLPIFIRYMVIYLSIFVLYHKTCFTLGVNFDFHLNDIFDNRLMALQLFSPPTGNAKVLESVCPIDTIQRNNKCGLGINTAFKTMRFHRYMMNKFMMSNYITYQILFEGNENITSSIEKRLGRSYNEVNEDSKNKQANVGAVHKLLYDDGSERYKDWLQKTTTLDDILHQLEYKKGNELKSISPNRRQIEINTHAGLQETGDEDEFDDGDITGYALTSSQEVKNNQNPSFQSRWPSIDTSSNLPTRAPFIKPFNKNGYENTYDDYAPHHPMPNLPEQSSKQTKEIGLKDITDIALTTLAFLSFGMFILQVLMCITMGKDDNSNLMMLPMEATDANVIADDLPEEIRRKKRSTFTQDKVQMMNELSSEILKTIDAVTLAENNGKNADLIINKSICENNSYAIKQNFGQKFWIPIWSLGMGWLSARIRSKYGGSDENIVLLKSLTAIANGLNNKRNC